MELQELSVGMCREVSGNTQTLFQQPFVCDDPFILRRSWVILLSRHILRRHVEMNSYKMRVRRKLRELLSVPSRAEINSVLLGQLNIERILKLPPPIESLRQVEFRVFSQWGEDGIIQYLVNNVPIEQRIFIEFGVEQYTESNTRFLLMNDDWRGLVIDGNEDFTRYIKHDEMVCRRHDLSVVHCLLTKDNINDTFEKAGFVGDIGLLSIDVDGNDYWLWDAVTVVNPRIVVCEYNSVFGSDAAVTVPYTPSFQRTQAHHSDLYFGASLAALCLLAERKGYDFVGSSSPGINAFFVRKGLNHRLRKVTAKEGYIQSSQRESRDAQGNLTYVGGAERLSLIKNMDVIDVSTNKRIALTELMRSVSSSNPR
jgi:hypothetical protein